jgi:HSP20 family molecular chaperone IbpA
LTQINPARGGARILVKLPRASAVRHIQAGECILTSPKIATRMLVEAVEWMREADRLQRQFFGLAAWQRGGPRWEPPIDIVERGNRLVVFVALPGVAAEAVEVTLDGGGVQVLAARAMCGGISGQMRRLEIPFGHFERRIELPPGRYQLVSRELANGCLVMTLDRLV